MEKERTRKAEIAYRFRRSVESYNENAIVQKLIVEQLADLVGLYVTSYPQRILEIGCGTGLLTEKIAALFPEKSLFINDLVKDMCGKTAGKCKIPTAHCLVGDIEVMDLPTYLDLIVSSSTFQWLVHPKMTYKKLADGLIDGGWLVFSSFGEHNFEELKQLTGKGLVYQPLQEISKHLSAYFEIVYAGETLHRLHFRNPMEILQHIKKTGVNATASSQIWTREHLKRFSFEYTARFGCEEGLPLTYHPLYLVCRKKL